MTGELTPAEQRAATNARTLIAETQYFDELGLTMLASRSRIVAADLVMLVEALQAERGVRRSLQARCERLQDLIGKAAYDACRDAVGR